MRSLNRRLRPPLLLSMSFTHPPLLFLTRSRGHRKAASRSTFALICTLLPTPLRGNPFHCDPRLPNAVVRASSRPSYLCVTSAVPTFLSRLPPLMSCTLCACFPLYSISRRTCLPLFWSLLPSMPIRNLCLDFPNGTVPSPLVTKFMYCQRV